MTLYAGKSGSVNITVSGTDYAKPLTDWSMDVKVDGIEVTNFTSGGWQEQVSGIYSVDITASGPYDGDSKITQGTNARFKLGIGGGGPTFTVDALVSSVKVETSVKDVAKITYTASSSGTPPALSP